MPIIYHSCGTCGSDEHAFHPTPHHFDPSIYETVTVRPEHFDVQWDAAHKFPFFEDENADGIYGYGHHDPAEFARLVNLYDEVSNGEPMEWQYKPADVVHTYALAFAPIGKTADEDEWRFTWRGVTHATPGAFAMTVVPR